MQPRTRFLAVDSSDASRADWNAPQPDLDPPSVCIARADNPFGVYISIDARDWYASIKLTHREARELAMALLRMALEQDIRDMAARRQQEA